MTDEGAKTSLGVDVSEAHGLDLVLLSDSLHIRTMVQHASLEDLARSIQELKPNVVAIDAPPCWGRSGGSREAEKALRRLGIHSYGTPSDLSKREHGFYRWMKMGMEAFDVCARAGYLRFVGGDPLGTAMEVFPHASATALAGGLSPESISKRDWRRSLLIAQGLAVRSLSTLDLIDAALAALTGLHALRGDYCAVGDRDDGVIVLPCRDLPSQPYQRLPRPRIAPDQPHLPHLAPCACGDPDCHELTDAEFAPGHVAKRKALLWHQARDGKKAVDELLQRKWELPPDVRF